MVSVTTTGWPVRITVLFGTIELKLTAFDHADLTALKKSFMELSADDIRELKERIEEITPPHK